LSEAVAALKLYAVSWFQEWGSPALLLEKLEISIEQRKPLIEVVEPLSREQEEVLRRTWPQALDTKLAVPVLSYFSASVLHYWLNRLSPGDQAERGEALAQLSALRIGLTPAVGLGGAVL
jgi:hypothetical protein